MFNGMWEEFLNSEYKEKYDLIFVSHVLEHIVNPLKFIRECATICNRYIFIEVPCLDYKFKDEPYGMFSDEHVNFFTIQGLWSLMNRAGFAAVDFEIYFVVHRYSSSGFPSIVTLWCKSNTNKVDTPIFSSTDYLNRYLDVSERLWQQVSNKIDQLPKNEKLSLWGVGNHLAKLLAGTSLKEKNIVRIYDSDKHKHGHKILDIPVTAFNDEDIRSGKVESILITTYTAQKAIVKAVETMNLPCKVYTLYDI